MLPSFEILVERLQKPEPIDESIKAMNLLNLVSDDSFFDGFDVVSIIEKDTGSCWGY